MYTFVPYPSKMYESNFSSIRVSGQGVDTTRIAVLKHSYMVLGRLAGMIGCKWFNP